MSHFKGMVLEAAGERSRRKLIGKVEQQGTESDKSRTGVTRSLVSSA